MSDTPLSITLISADFAPNVGGVAAHVVELGKALAKSGQRVTVVTLPLGDEREADRQWQGMRVLRPNIPKAEPLYSWLLNRWLQRFLNTAPQQILHVHGMRPLRATRGLGLPVIFTNHTSGYLKRIEKGGRELDKIASRLRHIDCVLAPSQELCDATAAAGYPGPIRFISNGVDTDQFTPGDSEQRTRLGIPEDHTVALLARRLVEKNGVVVYAEAITRLADLPVSFLFAGDGPERGKVEQIVRDAGMAERCHFLGNVPNSEMRSLYRAADLSALPSFMEATSITGLESMACGLPLVGTRVGGIPVLIEEGETGLLVPPGEPEAIAGAMRKLLADPERRRAMGAAARKRAVDHFSWKEIARQTLETYREYTGERI